MFAQMNLNKQRDIVAKVTAALGVQPNEATALGLLFGQSFFIGLTLITFYVAANALFLAAFEPSAISYTYLVVAITTIILGYLFAKLQAQYTFSLTIVVLTLFLLFSILAMRIGLWLTDAKWVPFLLMVWVRILYSMANLQLFAMAGRLFTVRQGKRLFPLIAAGAVLAIILLGAFSSLLINFLGTTNLLWLTVASLIMVLYFVGQTIRHFRPQLNQTAMQHSRMPLDKTQVSALLRSRFVQLILLFSFLVYLGAQLLDYIYLSQAAIQFDDVDALGQFFAYYMGGSTLVNLLFLTLVASRLLERYGLSLGLISRPSLIALGAVSIALTGTIAAPAVVIFACVVITRLFDEVTAAGLMGTSLRVLYQVLPANRRVFLQTIVETLVGPLATGISGLLLILFAASGAVTGTQANYLLLIIIIGGTITAVWLGRQYKVALQHALAKRFVGHDSLHLNDPNTIKALQKYTQSHNAAEVIFALTLLSEGQHKSVPQLLHTLLHHPNSTVRQHVLHQIEARRLVEIAPQIEALLAQESDPHVKGLALSTLSALGDSQALAKVATYTDAAEPAIQVGALVGLLRYGDVARVVQAGQRLLHLVAATNPANRILAARVIGKVAADGFYEQLLPLLADEDESVQQAALTATGQLKHPNLWPHLLAKLEHPTLGEFAKRALIANGEPLLTHLQTVIEPTTVPPHTLITYIKLIGRIGGPIATTMLLTKIDWPEPYVRLTILQALSRCQYQANDAAAITTIQERLDAEINETQQLLVHWLGVGDAPEVAVLRTALATDIETCRERLFYLLSFLHDTNLLLQIRQNLQHGSEEQQAYALESLDSLLNAQTKTTLLPLLLPLSPRERWQRLHASLTDKPLDPLTHLQTLINSHNPYITVWVKGCAIYIIGQLQIEAAQTALTTIITTTNMPVLRETAVWTLAQLRPSPDTLGEKEMLLTIEKIFILQSVTIFKGLPNNVLAELAQALEDVFVSAGETIWLQGDTGNAMYIITEGKVHIHQGTYTIDHLQDRAIFGEMAVLSPAPRMASATAVTDTHLLRLNQKDLYELIDDHREVAHGIIQVLSQRLRHLTTTTLKT